MKKKCSLKIAGVLLVGLTAAGGFWMLKEKKIFSGQAVDTSGEERPPGSGVEKEVWVWNAEENKSKTITLNVSPGSSRRSMMAALVSAYLEAAQEKGKNIFRLRELYHMTERVVVDLTIPSEPKQDLSFWETYVLLEGIRMNLKKHFPEVSEVSFLKNGAVKGTWEGHLLVSPGISLAEGEKE